MKRVAILVHGGVEPEGTGVHIPFLVELIERLSQWNDIEVMTIPSQENTQRASALNVPVHFISSDRRDIAEKKFLKLFQALWKAHSRRRFDVVHAIWLNPSGIVALAHRMIRHTPVVLSFHGNETASFPELGYGGLRSRTHRTVLMNACRFANAVTVLSSQQRSALNDAGVTRDNITVIPPGVDIQRFSFLEKPLGTPLRLLHVANLTQVKDQRTLLFAFRRIKRSVDARLRIIGADYLDGELHRQTREMALSDAVEFCGYVSHEDLPTHYHWADMYLQTSLHEAGGVAAAEAMASGVVVCGTRVGILADLGDDIAQTVPVGEAEALAVSVLQLLASPARMEMMRTRARKWAESHSIDSAASAFESTYRKVLDASRVKMHD